MKDFWEKCGASQKHVGHDCTEQLRGRGKREGERGKKNGIERRRGRQREGGEREGERDEKKEPLKLYDTNP